MYILIFIYFINSNFCILIKYLTARRVRGLVPFLVRLPGNSWRIGFAPAWSLQMHLSLLLVLHSSTTGVFINLYYHRHF